MAVGYEARARVTADMSGFVTASREAAQAGKLMSQTVKELNAELKELQQTARAAGAATQTFTQKSQQTAQQQGQAANSTQNLTRAMQQGAQAYNAAALAQHLQANAQSQAAAAANKQTQAQQQSTRAAESSTSVLRAMGRELERLERQQNTLNQVQRENGRLSTQQSEALTTVRNRLTELRERYGNLSQQQREAVDTSRQLAAAQRSVAEAQSSMTRFAREAVTEQRELAKAQEQTSRTTQVAESHLRSMGREMQRLSEQRRALMLVQNMNNQLSVQEQAALSTTRERLRQLGQEYARLSTEQRASVDASRSLVQAQQATSSGLSSVSRYAREMTTEQQAMNRAASELQGSLWSLRSAAGDVTGTLAGMGATAGMVTSALWQNFSAQEMTIAQISRVSQATALELNQITSAVRQMSTEIPLAFDELGEIAMLGSQVGVSNAALIDFTETVALFAATSEISADETATLMARIMEMSNIPEDQVVNLGSAVAYLGSNSAATDKEILTTIESITTMTTQAGMSAQATIGLGAAMASLRIRPEIARGASQRVFLLLGEAASGAGEEMEKLVELTGLTQEELQAMAASDFDQFFMRIMEGLNGAKDSAGGLIPILRELGIRNTRDADVIARLAANYGVLEGSMNDASTAFADGTYLYAESDRIFSTLTAKVQILGNTFSNFMYSAVESVAPFIGAIVEAATATLNFVDALGLSGTVGGAAALLAIAAAAATVAASIGFAYQGWLGFQGLLTLWSQRSAQAAVASGALAASTNAVAVSSTRATVAAAGMAAANMRSASAATAGTVANTGLAASMAGATAAARAFVLAHPATAVIAVGAAAIGAAVAWGDFGNATQRAQEETLKANEAHITAAGGLVSLKQALDADTQAWEEARSQAAEHTRTLEDNTSAWSSQAQRLVEFSAYRVSASAEMSEADQAAATDAEQLAARQRELAEELGTATEQVGGASQGMGDLAAAQRAAGEGAVAADNSIGQLNQSIDGVSDGINDNVYAVGLATRQWAAMSLESAVLETGILRTEEAFQSFQDTGADLSAALTMELNNAGDGAEYLRGKAEEVRSEMGLLERAWSWGEGGVLGATEGFWDWRTEADKAAESLESLADNLESTTLSINEASIANDLLANSFVEMPDGTRATVEELGAYTEGNIEAAAATEMMDAEISALGMTVEELYEAFTGFMDPLGAWSAAQDEANDKAREANEAFGQLGEDANVSFSDFLDNLEEMSDAQMNWARNLLSIADEVPPEVLAGLSDMGVEGAQIVQGLVDATGPEVDRFVELWAQGAGLTSEEFSIMFGDFINQAVESGDTGGTEFVDGLMAQVAAGEISFTEAVDQMTEYAEQEFEESDPTSTPQLENTQALQDLTSLIRRIEEDMREADATTEVEVETGGAWDQIVSWWDAAQDWLGRSPLWAGINIATNGPTKVNQRGRKDGGWVEGPGGPREDKVPMWASPTEFVVNSWSAQRYGGLLEWINDQRPGAASSHRAPNFAPDKVMTANRAPAPLWRTQTPEKVLGAQRSNIHNGGPKTVIHVTNHYPQAEPTSTTTNRTLAFAAALDGLG